MRIRCRQCGANNHPQNYSCLTCGANLAQSRQALTPAPVAPEASVKAVEAQATVVSDPPVQSPSMDDPSALTAAAESNRLSENVRGLFPEEWHRETRQSHRARYLLIVVVGLSAAAAGWHWRGIHIFANRVASKTSPQPTAPPISPSPSAVSETARPQPVVTRAVESNLPQAGVSQANVASVEQAPTEALPAHSRRASRRSKARIRPASEITRTPDPVEAEGEKYLNGAGVPVDCDRAQKDLLAAARHSRHGSVKAERALGGMYASGHCAIRDLPLAYRWLARAQRQNRRPDPKLANDMKDLWNQMSPEERTLAMR